MAMSGGWIGPLTDMLMGIGNEYENAKLSKGFSKLNQQDLGAATTYGNQLMNWSDSDWQNFKKQFAPVEQQMTQQAVNGFTPNVGGVVSNTAADAMQTGNQAAQQTEGGMLARGINPASGAFISGENRVQNAGATNLGIGINQARTNELNRVNDLNFANRMSVANMGNSVRSGANNAQGMALDTVANRDINSALAQDAARNATNAWGKIGQGAGNLTQQYLNSKKPYSSPDYNNSGQPDYTWSNSSQANDFNSQNAAFGLPNQFRDGGKVPRPKAMGLPPIEGHAVRVPDGGMVSGPGSGRSDSIPAVVNGKAPASLSNGEYLIKAPVAKRIGVDNLKAFIAKYHHQGA